jgi:hypothetical protein
MPAPKIKNPPVLRQFDVCQTLVKIRGKHHVILKNRHGRDSREFGPAQG